jgi:hypothetical protein
MAGLVILLVAKTRITAGGEREMVSYARDQMVGRETRSGGWVFIMALVIILMLAVLIAG